MNKLQMQSADGVSMNIEKIAALFPNCVTETTDKDGNICKGIDFDKLKEELSDDIIDNGKERYQFTWPDKRQAIHTANTPITKTLRPCREDSVDFDNTQNLYIEGDNLDVLKLLRENYLGKVKMIYIDPPYNTGNDFVYNDNFKMDEDLFSEASGERDEVGNRMVVNSDSNGRFHTDWLNMMYPRLKVARDLLTEDGVIFISIDDNEVSNLKKICDEIYGEENFTASFPWRKRTAKSDVPFGISQDYEQILCYAKSKLFEASIKGNERKYYETEDFSGKPWRYHDLTKQTTASERPNSFFTIVNPKNGESYPANPNRTWCITKETFEDYYKANRIIFPGDYEFLKIDRPVLRYWKEDDMAKSGDRFGMIAVSTKLPDSVGMSQDGTKEISELFESKIFSFPKPTSLLKFIVTICNGPKDIYLDFFSGSATTAHSVLQLNREDAGSRKFIMVQVQENTDKNSNTYKAGYKNICEIGKERIRRAAKKIKAEMETEGKDTSKMDFGFRVLKLDSSNMKDVYYTPQETKADLFSDNNVKEDRTAEDLLFQVMPKCDLMLSEKITKENINGKDVYFVKDNYLAACFDNDLTDDVIKEIAKRQPYHFVMKEGGAMKDSVLDNFEQIFKTYSAGTKCMVI
ncbi:MAG: site-specific DNA-methyltransferase [Paludibacteraceae bacterium]|nr:site-specific DNA-methyltransferase [Paludibacteraceae bacterium]